MLELKNVSLAVHGGASAGPRAAGEERWLLRGVSAHFPYGHLCAVVGPSGCGKSTLLKVIAGVKLPDEGEVHWQGRNLEEHDLEPHEIGYVPQFSIAFDF